MHQHSRAAALAAGLLVLTSGRTVHGEIAISADLFPTPQADRGPDLSNAWTLDILVTVSDDDDWSGARSVAQIYTDDPGEVFFQHWWGADVPRTPLWGPYPHLAFDSWYQAPNGAGVTQFGPSFPVNGDKILAGSMPGGVTWFDQVDSGGGTFIIARFTMFDRSGMGLTLTRAGDPYGNVSGAVGSRSLEGVNLDDPFAEFSFNIYVQSPFFCGNEVVEGEEECDDGNNEPGDGCDGSCRIEIALGACCADATCRITTEAKCLADYGDFYGVDSFCDTPDLDGDGLRDECDEDDDGDAVPDQDDACPFEYAGGMDADGDGCIDTMAGATALIDRFGAEEFPKNVRNSLAAKLRAAHQQASRGNYCAAINVLAALQHHVRALGGKKVSHAAAEVITAYAHNLIAQLRAELPEWEPCR